MSYVNINKLHEELEQRRIKRHIIYEHVLESINLRIKNINSTSDNCYMFYAVPAFISGMPIRDRPACIQYVMEHLVEMGFITRFLNPNYIYISWRHAKYHPVNPNDISSSGSIPGEYVNPALAAGFRLPSTNIMTGSGQPKPRSFSDQVRANNMTPHKQKMLAFETVDEQFRAGNEHYNPNFQSGSIDTLEPGPPPLYDTVPSHIQLAHRPYLDPSNPIQPTSHHNTYQSYPNTTDSYQGSSGIGQIKSVSFNGGSGKGGSRSRKPRESNGPLSLDDFMSPKSGSASKNNTVMPINSASNYDIAQRNNQLNSLLAEFGNNKTPPPNNGIPNDIIGTLL